MVINVNLSNNNIIYYYDIEKTKSEDGYNASVYRSFSTKEQDLFPVLKSIITTKEEVDAEFFITKLNKVFKREPAHSRSFGQTAKQIVILMNSYEYTLHNLKLPLVLSIPYLDGKPLPKIEKICLIDNNMYFVTKYKKEYIMHAVSDENMKCMIPVSNIINLYRRLKKGASVKKNIKRKLNPKSGRFSHVNASSHMFQMEELIIPTPTPIEWTRTGRHPVRRSRQQEELRIDNTYRTIPLIEPLPPIEQNDNDGETVEITPQLLERHLPAAEPVGQSEPETIEQPIQAEQGEIAEPIRAEEGEVAEPIQAEQGGVAEPVVRFLDEPAYSLSSPPSSNNSFYYDMNSPIRYPSNSDAESSVFEERVETIYNAITGTTNNLLRSEEGAPVSVEESERTSRLLAEEESLSLNEINHTTPAENFDLYPNDSDPD